jgi:hypothetical protein
MKSARRRDTLGGGVAKHRTPARRAFVSHIPERESPAPSLPDLLNQAEEELREASTAAGSSAGARDRSVSVGPVSQPEPEAGLVHGWRAGVASLASPAPSWDMGAALAAVVPAWAASPALLTPMRVPHRAPSPAKTESTQSSVESQAQSQTTASEAGGPRAWVKQDWKLLDMCFTDARLAAGLAPGQMVDADAVALDAVVDRFCDVADVEEMGWSRWVPLHMCHACGELMVRAGTSLSDARPQSGASSAQGTSPHRRRRARSARRRFWGRPRPAVRPSSRNGRPHQHRWQGRPRSALATGRRQRGCTPSRRR